MLIEPRCLRRYWRLEPATILHVGAHEAEELPLYQSVGWGKRKVTWVEALPDKAAALRDKLQSSTNHSVVEALAWSTSGERISFTETNNTQSSSALELGEHRRLYPDIRGARRHSLVSTRLEEVIDFSKYSHVDLLNMDIQGAELEALKGMESVLGQIRAIYCEVNLIEIYQGNPTLRDLNDYLAKFGFILADSEILLDGWGDALWLREGEIPPLAPVRRWARRLDQRVGNIYRDLSRRTKRA